VARALTFAAAASAPVGESGRELRLSHHSPTHTNTLLTSLTAMYVTRSDHTVCAVNSTHH